jgi:hypothetical protein
LAQICASKLRISERSLGDEYYYQSLPLCIIDAVFSIGVRYEGVQAIVQRYCDFFQVQKIRSPKSEILPVVSQQESIPAFCQRFEAIGLERMTMEVFRNRQRTSTRNGILKSEAVLHFARVLKRHRINFLQDLDTALLSTALDADIRQIPGQKSGISLKYFFMLAGSDNFIKPDRMVIRFLEHATNRKGIPITEASALLIGAADELRGTFPHLTPRLLDYLVWNFQREKPSNPTATSTRQPARFRTKNKSRRYAQTAAVQMQIPMS